MIPEAGLPGGASERGAVRVGDTVRRPPGPAAELVREVLRRLESAGFEEAPRRRGRAEQGRDVLTWIEGDTHTDRSRLHPYVGDPPDRVLFADEQLAAATTRRSPATSSATAASGRGTSSGGTAFPWR